MNNINSHIANPVRELLEEHAVFMRALEELVDVMNGVPDDAESLPYKAMGTAERVWHEVNEHLNTHFVKEEEVFFPAIEPMFPGARVKFQYLHVDHDKLRDCFDEYTLILQNCRVIGSANRDVIRLKVLGKEMVRLFYYHIVVEDAFYFEVAEQTMTPEEATAIQKQMNAIEHRLRERVEVPTEQRRVANEE